MRKTILITILLFILASCRGYIERPSDTQDITTWAEFFDLWWNKMDQDYVFWSFDSPADEWDQVRKDAVPKMESYGNIVKDSKNENTRNAARLLFDLTKDLTDGHFQLRFDSNFNIGSFSPFMYRKMREAGLSDEESFELRYTPDTDLRLWNESDFIAENTKSIMQETFKIAIADESNINQPYTTVSTNEIYDGHFEKAGYVAYSSVPFQDGDSFYMFLGKSSDGILYLAFSDFAFTTFLKYTHVNEDAKAVVNLLQAFQTEIDAPDTTGVIIDLRGNGGGLANDLQMLWGIFVSGNVDFGEIRTKRSDNRLSYGTWNTLSIEGMRESPYANPVVVICNSMSASCSEMSLMIFKALREQQGVDVTITGGISAGANGMITDNDTFFDAGSFSVGGIVTVRTPFSQIRYIDGTFYEGKGIVPDDVVNFNYTQFTTGNDLRLEHAFECI